jgi:hypothetical protein
LYACLRPMPKIFAASGTVTVRRAGSFAFML